MDAEGSGTGSEGCEADAGARERATICESCSKSTSEMSSANLVKLASSQKSLSEPNLGYGSYLL
jgi:hypothetical protein